MLAFAGIKKNSLPQESSLHCEARLNYVIALKNTLDLLQPLAGALEGADNQTLINIRQVCIFRGRIVLSALIPLKTLLNSSG